MVILGGVLSGVLGGDLGCVLNGCFGEAGARFL